MVDPTISVSILSVYNRYHARARRELNKGSAELLILALLEPRPRHGYELGTLIQDRSQRQLIFHVDSLYPLRYRLEERGWIKGSWVVEQPAQRRRRFYALTPAGRRMLAQQRKTWAAFVEAVRRGTGGEHA